MEQAVTELYHPTGAKVNIPISLGQVITTEQASTLVASVDALINAGFTVNLPGLMDGENFEQIGSLVRREKQNDDDTITPVIDVYPINGNFRILGLYLNTPDDVKTFEAAAGFPISALPVYDGNPIERGKNTKIDQKYIVTLKDPMKLVWKFNPKWEGDKDQKHPKRVFVRWDGVRPQNGDAGDKNQPQPSSQAPATKAHLEMTYDEACKTKTPKGANIGELSGDQLKTLSTSTAANVTDAMREAAKIVLTHSDALPY
jgi:hypothetical protein